MPSIHLTNIKMSSNLRLLQWGFSCIVALFLIKCFIVQIKGRVYILNKLHSTISKVSQLPFQLPSQREEESIMGVSVHHENEKKILRKCE